MRVRASWPGIRRLGVVARPRRPLPSSQPLAWAQADGVDDAEPPIGSGEDRVGYFQKTHGGVPAHVCIAAASPQPVRLNEVAANRGTAGQSHLYRVVRLGSRRPASRLSRTSDHDARGAIHRAAGLKRCASGSSVAETSIRSTRVSRPCASFTIQALICVAGFAARNNLMRLKASPL